MKRLAAVAFFFVLSLVVPQARSKAAPAFASSTDPCPPPPAVVASFLGFTPDQAAQFGALLSQFQANLHALQEQTTAQQAQLDNLLNQPHPDPAAVGKLVLQIHALQQQVAQAIQSFQTLFAGLLTAQQMEKVQGVTQASQLQPVVGAFVSLYLVPAPPSLPCQKQ